MLVAALLLSTLAFAAYRALTPPDPETVALRKNMELFKKELAGDDVDFEKTLNALSDKQLMALMAEAADYLEEIGAVTEYSLFAPIAMERLAPNVTPSLMGSILTNPDLPMAFRQIILELGIYGHSTMTLENGFQVEPAYERVLRDILVTDALPDADKDQLTVLLIIDINWRNTDEDKELLLSIFNSKQNLPRSKGYAMRYLAMTDPVGIKDLLYDALEHFDRYDDDTVHGMFIGLSLASTKDLPQDPTHQRTHYADAPQFVMDLLDNFLRYDDKPGKYSNGTKSLLISEAAIIMGKTHTPGLISYLAQNEALLPRSFEEYAFDISLYLYPEVDDMLRSADPETVALALRCVESDPLIYYIDTLEELTMKKGPLTEQARQASQALELCQTEGWYSDLDELATKEGNWGKPASLPRQTAN